MPGGGHPLRFDVSDAVGESASPAATYYPAGVDATVPRRPLRAGAAPTSPSSPPGWDIP
ncbi:hypothetical protein MSAS_52030 [Mycobacterium saskatchewanense]|nr:hypothetical protein MSAS_52030 [Mycobacterium saskatchewanense]